MNTSMLIMYIRIPKLPLQIGGVIKTALHRKFLISSLIVPRCWLNEARRELGPPLLAAPQPLPPAWGTGDSDGASLVSASCSGIPQRFVHGGIHLCLQCDLLLMGTKATPRRADPFLAQRRCQNPREQSAALEGEHPSDNPRDVAGSPPGCRGRLPSTAPCP